MTSRQPIEVTTQSFDQIVSHQGYPLALDSYQRGFVWDKEKVTQLVDDLCEFQKTNNKLAYYMGVILLHEDDEKEKRFIIDGQQRITALCILYHKLHQSLPVGQVLSYSGQSERCILNAVEAYGEKTLPDPRVFKQLKFTVIVVKNVDLAFTFFDTQNNRGVPLQATDLLKAYHLRAIDYASADKNQSETLQLECASRWEAIQRMPTVLFPYKDFAQNLFTRFLWRARRWAGNHVTPVYHDGLIEEFQKRTWSVDEPHVSVDRIPVFPCRDNRLASSLGMQNGVLSLYGHSVVLGNNAALLPMALRQPIYEGVGFFLYADKYAAILQDLMSRPANDERVVFFRSVYEELLKKNQEYLREAFVVSSLVYVDQFGYQGLSRFALYLEFILGGIRLNKQQVKRETAANFFRDGELNLLDVIVQSYHPRQVHEYLTSVQKNSNDVYKAVGIEDDSKENDSDEKIYSGVQGRYKKAVINFYSNENKLERKNLADKLQWMMRKMETLEYDH